MRRHHQAPPPSTIGVQPSRTVESAIDVPKNVVGIVVCQFCKLTIESGHSNTQECSLDFLPPAHRDPCISEEGFTFRQSHVLSDDAERNRVCQGPGILPTGTPTIPVPGPSRPDPSKLCDFLNTVSASESEDRCAAETTGVHSTVVKSATKRNGG